MVATPAVVDEAEDDEEDDDCFITGAGGIAIHVTKWEWALFNVRIHLFSFISNTLTLLSSEQLRIYL